MSRHRGASGQSLTWAQKAIVLLLAIYVATQLVIPFRRVLYPSQVDWSEEGYFFSWRMMLRSKKTGVQFVLFDPQTGRVEPVDVTQWLTPRQIDQIGTDPEMLREFAAFVRDQFGDHLHQREVRVIALCSLNGRKPQLMVDPQVDLGRQPRTLGPQPWVVELREPFRWQPWDIPMIEWQEHVNLDSRQAIPPRR